MISIESISKRKVEAARKAIEEALERSVTDEEIEDALNFDEITIICDIKGRVIAHYLELGGQLREAGVYVDTLQLLTEEELRMLFD